MPDSLSALEQQRSNVLTQILHLGHRQAGIVSNDNDLGGLEDLSKGADEFALCRAIHQLSPVGGPTFAEAAGLMQAVPPQFVDESSPTDLRQDDV